MLLILFYHFIGENGLEDKYPFVCDSLTKTELKSFCTVTKSFNNCQRTCSMLDESATSTTTLGQEGTTKGF